MEKIKLMGMNEAEDLEVFVLEETVVNEQKYLLVTETESGDCEASILKVAEESDDEYTYIPVEDEVEFSAVAKIFEELVEDTDFEF